MTQLERLTASVTYNDDFDRQHYPLDQWHYDTIGDISEIMELSPTLDWVYIATSSGKCFTARVPKSVAGRCARVYADHMKRLLAVPGFRWIETKGDTIDIGIEHSEAVAKQRHAIVE